jgi:hypothetical protein
VQLTRAPVVHEHEHAFPVASVADQRSAEQSGRRSREPVPLLQAPHSVKRMHVPQTLHPRSLLCASASSPSFCMRVLLLLLLAAL